MDCQLHDAHHHIMTISGVLSAAECRAHINWSEDLGFGAAPITTPAGFRMRPDIRNNTRVMVDDPARAEALWERLADHVPARLGEWRAVGLNERLRLYRYDAGQYFRWHLDGAFQRSHREQSLLTLMVYLNDDFEGGDTEFEGGPSVRPRQGAALLFLHPVLHQGAPIRAGRKYVLRSDVMYRR